VKPWQRAKKWQLENSDIPFEVVLADYMLNGYVVSGQDCFIMGKPVLWEKDEMHSGEEANCWFVQLAAGRNALMRFLDVAPFELEYVAWQRRGSERYHVYKWDDYRRKVKRWDRQI
jgi:hypothetical protein